ncbi:MAG: ribonuclease P protein component [Candidatus Cloacimonas sp.]
MVKWITSHSDYADFFHPAFEIRTTYFYVPVLRGESAAGITISRKIGNAVKRNLLKRRIKSWLRTNQENIPVNYRFNLIAKTGAADLKWQELSQELLRVINQLTSKASC